MGNGKQLTVGVALTPDPAFIPALQGLVSRLAEQMGFPDSQRISLQHGVERTCRWMMEKSAGDGRQELHLQLTAFSDRLEIVVEDAGGASEMPQADSFLLSQLLDRVVFETTDAGKVRVTLVKYVAPVGSQP